MIEVKTDDKQRYLNENYPFSGVPSLTDKRECLHCGDVIKVGDYKVFKDDEGEEFICCPNAPKCNGSVIYWMGLNG